MAINYEILPIYVETYAQNLVVITIKFMIIEP